MTKLKFLIPLVLTISSSAIGDEIKIGSSGITLDAPAGFELLEDEVIAAKWAAQKPQWAIGTEGAISTIAYDLKPNDISAAPMDALLGQFKNLFDSIVPEIEWVNSDVVTIDESEWVYMEFTSSQADTKIHNISLATSHGKEMVVININSTEEEFKELEDEIRASVDSIDLP